MSANKIYRRVKFILSAPTMAALAPAPDEGYEIAFVGRSNVGKSSAFNTLMDHNGLARTSKTPGRTQAINLFEVDETRRLADLPGYGYAKVGGATRKSWGVVMNEYLNSRECLVGVVLLIDIRHPLKETDRTMLAWGEQSGIPIHLLLTKADKLSRNKANQALFALRDEMSHSFMAATAQTFSSLKKTGVDEALAKLDEWFELDDEV